MRIAIIAPGSRGDVQPYIALGKGLEQAGHAVRLVTHQNFEVLDLLQDIASWLHPGGLFVATMGVHSVKADFAEDYLGAPMYWSGFDSETNERLVEEAGLCIVST